MDIKDLERIMISHGVALRAIPEKVMEICEKTHIAKYPDGTIKYLEEFKRDVEGEAKILVTDETTGKSVAVPIFASREVKLALAELFE